MKKLMDLVCLFPPFRKERSGSLLSETNRDDSSPTKSPTKDLDEGQEGIAQDIDEGSSTLSSGDDSQELK